VAPCTAHSKDEGQRNTLSVTPARKAVSTVQRVSERLGREREPGEAAGGASVTKARGSRGQSPSSGQNMKGGQNPKTGQNQRNGTASGGHLKEAPTAFGSQVNQTRKTEPDSVAPVADRQKAARTFEKRLDVMTVSELQAAYETVTGQLAGSHNNVYLRRKIRSVAEGGVLERRRASDGACLIEGKRVTLEELLTGDLSFCVLGCYALL
jgi:hypothetical protein